jgi:hypothetical protein
MFPERCMSALEQDSGRADIRSERSQGRRSERSRGNVPFPCLPGVFLPPLAEADKALKSRMLRALRCPVKQQHFPLQSLPLVGSQGDMLHQPFIHV